MIFDALNLMVPLLKWHISLTWHSLTTKGVYSGGTQVQPNPRVLIRHPTSGFARAGLGGWGGGPWGTHPPPCHAGAGDGDDCLGWTCPPPLGKVTSGSSPLELLLPEVLPKELVENCWGMHAANKVQSPNGDPPWVATALGLQGCQALPGGGM